MSIAGQKIRRKRCELGLSRKILAERLSDIAMNQSRLYRIETGNWIRAYPLEMELERIAEELRLDAEDLASKVEKDKHAISLSKADLITTIEDARHTQEPTDFFIQMSTYLPDMIYTTGLEGNPQLSIIHGNELSTYFERFIGETTSSKLQNKILEAHGELLYMIGYSYHEVCKPNEVIGITRPISDEIRKMSEITESGNLYGLADLCIGVSHYIEGDYITAVEKLNNSILYTEDPNMLLRAQRATALSYANLHSENQFKGLETQIRQLIEGGEILNLDQICEAYLGLGWGRAILGCSGAFDLVEEAQSIYNQMIKIRAAPFRNVQLTLVWLDAMRRRRIMDKNHLEEVGTTSLELAQRHGYTRYGHRIKNMLEAFLN